MLARFWRRPARRTLVGRPSRPVVLALETLEERLPLSSAVSPAQTIGGVYLTTRDSSGTSTTTQGIFAVTPSKGLEYYNGSSWTMIGGAGTIDSISAVMQTPKIPVAYGAPNVTHDPAVFAITATGGLAEYDVATGWRQIGGSGSINAISAGLDSTGQADVYVITTGGELTEWSTSGGWLASAVGGSGSILNMSATDDGGVDAVTADHSLFRYTPGVGWMRLSSANFASSVSAVSGTDFVITTNGGLDELNSTGAIQVGGAGSIKAISAGTDASNSPEVFVITTNGEFASYGASGWQVLAAPNTVSQISAGGDDFAFVITSGGAVEAHSSASGWVTFSGSGFGQS